MASTESFFCREMMSGCEDSAEIDVILEMYQQWLLARGVRVANSVSLRSPLRKGHSRDKIPEVLRKEWGLMSLDKVIKQGTEICSVPMEACLRGDRDLNPNVTEEEDSQLHLAVPLLKAIAAGPSGELWPKVRTLPRSVGVCWAWPDNEREWLRGSELEEVMRRKRERLKTEHALVRSKNIECSYEAYFDACTVVISHANPWFGVCMVPFVDMGNHSDLPDVEFRRRGNCIVGKAIRSIQPWREIYQSYGDLGVADMLYRYGFTTSGKQACRPRNDDVVSIQSGHFLSFLTQSRMEIDTKADRIPLLKRAGVFCESPWFGLDDIAVLELSMPDDAASDQVQGLPDLLVAAHALQLDGARWRRVVHEADSARQTLANKVNVEDIEVLAFYTGLEVLESGRPFEEVITDLSPLIKVLPAGRKAAPAPQAGADPQQLVGNDGSDGSDSESEESSESGERDNELGWDDLIGPRAERAPWARSAAVIGAARSVLCGRDGLYPDDCAGVGPRRSLTPSDGGSCDDAAAAAAVAAAQADGAAGERLHREEAEREDAVRCGGTAGRNRAMALQLRIVERTIIAAAMAALARLET